MFCQQIIFQFFTIVNFNNCYFSRTARRKPLPKLVYNLLSDKELRKKNAEAGLPFHGDRKVCNSVLNCVFLKLLSVQSTREA